MIYLHHSIFEGDDAEPTLVHVFPGKTKEDCWSVLRIHATWDAFLAAAVTTGEFQGFPVRVEISYSEDDK